MRRTKPSRQERGNMARHSACATLEPPYFFTGGPAEDESESAWLEKFPSFDEDFEDIVGMEGGEVCPNERAAVLV